MRRHRPQLWFCWFALTAWSCTPEFAEVECFSTAECGTGQVCQARRCVAPQLDLGVAADGARPDDAARDQGPDAARDAAPDVDPPEPVELVGQWSFSPGLERVDTTGNWEPVELYGNARIEGGALFVDGYYQGSRGFARADGWSAGVIREKTYVAWVAIRGRDATAGPVLSLADRRMNRFDSLLWGHQGRYAWSPADDGVLLAPPLLARTADWAQQQVSLSWRAAPDGRAEFVVCLDGVEAVRGTDPGAALKPWGGEAELLIGTNQLTADQRGNWVVDGVAVRESNSLDARIDELRLYRGVLGCDSVAQLEPAADSDPPMVPAPEPELVGQWAFTPGAERVDSVGRWDDLEVYGDVRFEGGWIEAEFGEFNFARAVGWDGALIRDKTMVAWVELIDPAPHGAAALALDSRFPRESKVDSLSYYVLGGDQRIWVAPSNGRSQNDFGVRVGTPSTGVVYQVAASWRDVGDGLVEVALCVDGAAAGPLQRNLMIDFRDDVQALIGSRQLVYQVVGPHEIDGERQLSLGELHARMDEVRLYRGALSCAEVGALQPAP